MSVEQILERITDPNRTECIRMWEYFKTHCKDAKGSSHNHQNWEGGYFDHIKDILTYAITLYQTLSQIRPLPFELSDALLVLFLHDIEKPIKYTDSLKSSVIGKSNDDIRKELLSNYNFVLSEEHLLGLKYIHGEGDDYSSTKRVMSPLSAFCHCCDVISARIYFN